MTRYELLRFARRDWAAVASSKAAWWERVRREEGLDPVFRAVESLRAQAADAHPGWPDEASRDHDLATHQRVTEALARAGRLRRP